MAQKSTVLITDDDEIFLTVAEAMVEISGFSVLKARDGMEALEVFKEHQEKIVCIMLDIKMPRMNGIETLQRLREMGENIQVIISTGYLSEENLEKLAPLQPAAYLKKPFSHQELTHIIKQCLGDGEEGSINFKKQD